MDQYEVAKNIARFKAQRKAVYDALTDCQWHPSAELKRLASSADVRKMVSDMRRQGLDIEKRRYKAYKSSNNYMHEYRMKTVIPNKLIREAWNELRRNLRGGPMRSEDWFIGATAGVRAAKYDKENNSTTKNPYKSSSGCKTSWDLAYRTFMEHEEDITLQFVIEYRKKTEKRSTAGVGNVHYIREAMTDWEYQAKGFVIAESDVGKAPRYVLDPTITEEDKAFAARQLEVCRKELLRMGGKVDKETAK